MLREDRDAIYEEMVITEGANLEMREHFKDFKKKYSETMKKSRSFLKEKKFDQAINEANKAKKIIHDTYDKIQKEESTTGSIVFSLFTGNIPFLLREIVVGLLSIPTFGIAQQVNEIVQLVERIDVVIKDCKKKSFSVDDINLYKNALKVRMNEYDKFLDSFVKHIKEAKEKYKKKESK